jgi:methionine-rich copper-binding protein CopC
MAYKTITFESADITDSDASDGVVVVGGLKFTISAPGAWTLNFANNRLNFSEDSAFAGSQFKIEITDADGGPFKYSDYVIGYTANPAVVNGYTPGLNINGMTLGDTGFSGNYQHPDHSKYAWRYTSGGMGGEVTTSKITFIDEPVAGDTQNPYSTLWLDNIVVDTDYVPPNVAPTFVGATTSLSASQNSTSVDVSALLHVRDSDSAQTLTWSMASAPGHGTLALSGATAASGSTNISPGGIITYTPIAGFAGVDTFTVQVSDGTATTTRTITVNVNPSSPSSPDLATASDTGLSNTDNATGASTLAFSGTAAAGDTTSTVRVFVDGNGNGVYDAGTDASATATVNNGAWSVSGLSTALLASGTYNVYAQITSATGGLVSASSSALALTLDKTAPFITFSGLALSSDTGVSGSDFVTSVEAQTITGILSASLESGDRVMGSLDNGNTWTDITSNVSGTTLTWSGIILPGSNTIRLQVVDQHGNSGGTTAQAYVLDTTAPATMVSNAALSADTGLSAADFVTRVGAQTISGTLSANLTAGEIIQVSLNNGSTWTAAAASVGSSGWSLTGVTLSGSNTLQVKVTDAAGNDGPVYAQAYVLDTTAPTTTATSVIFSNDTGASTTDLVTSIAAQIVSGTLSTNLVPGEQVEVSFNNGASWSTASATTGSATWSLATTLAASNTLMVRVVDAAGNAGPTYNLAYVLDTTVPSAPSAPDLDILSDAGNSSDDNITSDTTPTFTGTAEAGATVTLYDGATVIGSAVATGGTWSITSTTLAQGTHSITAIATDRAGNQSPASSALAVEINTQAPATEATSVVFSSDTGASATDLVTRTAVQIVSGGLSANLAAGERVEVSFDNGSSWTIASAIAGSASWSLNTTLASGTHSLQVRVSNAVDNSGPVHTQEYTLDTVVPAVTITSSASQLKTGESATITFTFSEDPGATFSWDGSVGDVLVTGGTLSAISGAGLTRTATFTPSADVGNGTASITVDASAYADLAGNLGTAGATPSLHFDTLAPSAPPAPALDASSDSGSSNFDNLTNNTTLTLTGTAEAGSTIRLYDTDGVTEIGSGVATGGVWSITTSPLVTGSHTLTARATDAAGNRSPASAGLAVIIDGARPVLVQSSPVDDATNVGSTADLVLTFSEAVHKDTGTIELHASTGDLIEIFDVATSSHISIAGDVLTLDPTNPLSRGTSYYLTVSAGALKDTAGNSFAGIADASIFNFTIARDEPAGPAITPNEQGGRDITISDPAQLTASLGTSGVDHVFYSGSGTVILPDTIENITLWGNANVVGNELGNLMRRGSGENVLDGMGGNDTLYGDQSSDQVYGGSGNDVVSGGAGQDRVSGGSGSDNVQGGAGNDRVYGDAGRDTVSGGSGNDFVEGGSGVDRLSGAAGQDRLYGGEGRDLLSGGSGHDWLFGGSGQDTLHGGSGHDRFVFDTELSQSSNVDVIQDFTASEDRIVLDDAVFTKVGTGSARGVVMPAELFVAGIQAQGAEDRIIYDRATGSLYYDADGTGSAAQVKFATLSNKAALSYHDFLII